MPKNPVIQMQEETDRAVKAVEAALRAKVAAAKRRRRHRK
jgi:hypothetical protein